MERWLIAAAAAQLCLTRFPLSLTVQDNYLTVEDMSVIRATSLANYPSLVSELGGDPSDLLRASGIRPDDVGRRDVFLSYRNVVHAIESGAEATRTPDFGRRLAQRQGIEILGPVGVAARTAARVSDAFTILDRFMAAYSPAISARITPLDNPERRFFEFQIHIDRLPPHPQTIELSLGVGLRIFRFLLGSSYAPLLVHMPHEPLTSVPDYERYFSSPPRFAERAAGFTIRAADLDCSLDQDELAHQAVVQYLSSVITRHDPGIAGQVQDAIRHLLPTGEASLELTASHLSLHPKTLQRRLAVEGTTFAALMDRIRRESAERYLRDTDMSLTHLTHELGYAEQAVLTRACRRWFGHGPAAHRRALRASRSQAQGLGTTG